MTYSLAFDRPAKKALKRLSHEVASRVLQRAETLAIDPRPPGCLKLKGYPDRWRVRIGKHRLVYRIEDSSHAVVILDVDVRDDVYTDPS